MDIAPVYWGKGSWAVIFTTIYHLYKDFDELMYYLDNFYLPCKTCRDNLANKKNKENFGKLTSPSAVRDFFVELYNEHHPSDMIDITKLSNLDI